MKNYRITVDRREDGIIQQKEIVGEYENALKMWKDTIHYYVDLNNQLYSFAGLVNINIHKHAEELRDGLGESFRVIDVEEPVICVEHTKSELKIAYVFYGCPQKESGEWVVDYLIIDIEEVKERK